MLLSNEFQITNKQLNEQRKYKHAHTHTNANQRCFMIFGIFALLIRSVGRIANPGTQRQ